MRLFIGIELPENIRKIAASVADRIRGAVAREAPRSVVRWIPPQNLHVTVWFLGDVSDPKAAALVDVLKTPLGTGLFPLQIANTGAFPSSGPPRAIWLGLTEGRDALADVHDALRVRLAPLGFRPEDRPFSPHLTIGRAKDVHRADASTIRRILRDARCEPASGEIRHATLFKSRTLPNGSQYEVLLRVPLI